MADLPKSAEKTLIRQMSSVIKSANQQLDSAGRGTGEVASIIPPEKDFMQSLYTA